jgi:hypothetical protein
MRTIRWRVAHASSVLRSASCRTLLRPRFVFGKMPNIAGWKPALPGKECT